MAKSMVTIKIFNISLLRTVFNGKFKKTTKHYNSRERLWKKTLIALFQPFASLNKDPHVFILSMNSEN